MKQITDGGLKQRNHQRHHCRQALRPSFRFAAARACGIDREAPAGRAAAGNSLVRRPVPYVATVVSYSSSHLVVSHRKRYDACGLYKALVVSPSGGRRAAQSEEASSKAGAPEAVRWHSDRSSVANNKATRAAQRWLQRSRWRAAQGRSGLSEQANTRAAGAWATSARASPPGRWATVDELRAVWRSLPFNSGCSTVRQSPRAAGRLSGALQHCCARQVHELHHRMRRCQVSDDRSLRERCDDFGELLSQLRFCYAVLTMD